MQQIVDDIAAEIADKAAEIEAAGDAKEDRKKPGAFGIAVATVDDEIYSAGKATTPFPLQSIAKVFALELAMCAIGDKVFDRVGREPSGDPFNSIVDLERTHGIPRNPFINAGALAIVDILVEELGDDEQASAVVDFVRHHAGRDTVSLDPEVLASEHEGGDLNRAMMSFMRHHGNLHGSLDAVMEAYVNQCAITLDCRGLARTGLFLARTRRSRTDEAAEATAVRMRKLLGLMMTCGHYDGSGDFAVRVGLPAKSGVGGGIIAVAPERGAVAVWSPNLDQNGNSMLGVRALEMFGARTGWSVFGPPLD
ncbi:glutaminase A [Sphingomonas sp. NBWT7]|uniref:glutaminase A n=1 Tax=Sphingomonas sp. NBWT7 TaxID=2596913 RepID=UPI001629760C|nr:glutaminase A [Sphingomonas sp. NBWT7]QNE33268.1 glutaminase A [Sphingomonas sp. NBWT7]